MAQTPKRRVESGGTKSRERAVHQRRGREPTAGQRPSLQEMERYLSTLLNVISAAIDRVVIENIAQGPITLSLGDQPSPSKNEGTLRAMANGTAVVRMVYLLNSSSFD